MNLILTFDYELYGDGSGDIFKHIIEPTNKILDCCKKHNIKTTIFFEIIEFIKLEELWNKGNKMGYDSNPIDAIKNQIKLAAIDGHDIQLHIHPQWINALYVNNKWVVDFSNWRLGDFSCSNGYSIEDLLQEAKLAVEEIVQQVKPEYKCIALRAGAYNITPSKEVYNAMVKLGLKLDSSVYPGGYETGSLSQYDFRHAPINKDYWWVNPNDFSESKNKSEVMEVPVFALSQFRYRKFNLARIVSALNNKKSTINSVKSKTIGKSLIQKISWLFERESFTWDFCLFNSGMHKIFLKYIKSNLEKSRNNFVIIGHPKSLANIKSLEKFITISKDKKYRFKTLIDMYDTINANK
jgi:peptidoglycan/xylan/chitin deacetylase (PgdA/CDA1 family)